MDIIIDNSYKEIKNKNGNDNDELEAGGAVPVANFKNWLLRNYIDIDFLKLVIKNDLTKTQLSDKAKNSLIEKVNADVGFLNNFIEFYFQNGVVSF